HSEPRSRQGVLNSGHAEPVEARPRRLSSPSTTSYSHVPQSPKPQPGAYSVLPVSTLLSGLDVVERHNVKVQAVSVNQFRQGFAATVQMTGELRLLAARTAQAIALYLMQKPRRKHSGVTDRGIQRAIFLGAPERNVDA